MEKNKKINAFTMSELLIVLLVLGFLAVFTLSSLTKATPDRPKMLFKKAYSVVEKAVQELVNDETLYPYNPNKIGFMNDVQVQIPGGEKDEKTPEGSSGAKFRALFVDKLNILGEAKDDNSEFITTDGIQWKLPKEDFQRSNKVDKAYKITVDINGDKGPNQLASEHQDDFTSDQFEILVYFDGKVNVAGEVEKEFLTSHDLKREEKKEQTGE